jgi:hypothetical protein
MKRWLLLEFGREQPRALHCGRRRHMVRVPGGPALEPKWSPSGIRAGGSGCVAQARRARRASRRLTGLAVAEATGSSAPAGSAFFVAAGPVNFAVGLAEPAAARRALAAAAVAAEGAGVPLLAVTLFARVGEASESTAASAAEPSSAGRAITTLPPIRSTRRPPEASPTSSRVACKRRRSSSSKRLPGLKIASRPH